MTDRKKQTTKVEKQPGWLELETDQNVYKITLVWYIRWDIDANLEVFRTIIRNYLLSWVTCY